MLSDSPDSLAHIAGERNTVVIGCGAETVSGTFWLFAAQGGAILRRYNSCHSGMRERFERGTPLPPEVKTGIEVLDGEGLMAVLRHFDFDYDRWYEEGRRRVYQFTYDRSPEKGPLAREYEAHYDRNKLAPDERPPVRLVVGTAPKSSRRGCLGALFGFWWASR